MTVHEFCSSGEMEPLKGGAHALACGLCAVMAAYNLAAYTFRREPRLLGLGVLYAGGAVFEAKQTARHWVRCA
jgi:hypothetical protein